MKLNYNDLTTITVIKRCVYTERFLNTFLMDEAGVEDPVLWDRVAGASDDGVRWRRSRVGSGDEPRFRRRLENTLLTLNTDDDTCRDNESFIDAYLLLLMFGLVAEGG